MLKKVLTTLQAIVIIATFLVVSCAIPATDSEVGTLSQVSKEQALAEKSASRSVSWERVASINNARDIAAFDNVYVVSADGKTIYEKEKSATDFVAMTDGSYIFSADPIVKIAAGNSMMLAAWGSSLVGIAVITESGKVYGYHSSYSPYGYYKSWGEIRNVPGTPIDIGFCAGRGILIATQSGNEYNVYNYNGMYMELDAQITKPFGQEIVAIDVNQRFLNGSNETVRGLTILTADNNVSDIANPEASNAYVQVLNAVGCIPSIDIAADVSKPASDQCYATFNNNTGSLYYINPTLGTKVSCGAARKISISKDGYIWDAYSSGIWKAKL